MTSKILRNQRRRLISKYIIERRDDLEIQEHIYNETGSQVSLRTIRRDRRQIREEATKFFYLLAKDNHEYNLKLKITIDSLESTLSDLKQEYNNSTDIAIKLKLADSLLKYEKEVFEYYKYLPTINQLEPEPEYTNTKACADSAGPISTQQTEELYGLELPPWDNNHWSQCDKCKRWFKNELVDNSCIIQLMND